ncbi:beta-galactosidase [Clostridium beijerinckii]|uniref:Beta-galactosidase n=1 Tax=Clostridium beijerinckii TaxID=1520 RepID=A0A1S8RMA5_CLOBE|nr:beta-galactosidase [Clostridium beijerinckii]NRY62232.1 beta-galactosidase [Clostridium beijerinckii]OOM54322.1 beta-galactosidase GanA [Clostridium beijerinckii]
MKKEFPVLSSKINGFLHGGDYNPDQWLNYPEVLKEDVRLMKLANCNCVSINIFGWSAIEPKEGKYTFDWLDKVMNDMEENNIHVILSTPSGARPAWMSEKYPEVLRVNSDRSKNLHGQRHNHCFTSPVYRKKTYEINKILAERYKDHPALIMWHVSNEYGGECHCGLCQNAFREWLKRKYDNNLDKLNEAWWTGFWSHRFNSWSQIESPSEKGEMFVHGHNLDWKRFVTDQTIDFYKNEIAPIREITSNIPVTANFMGNYPRMGLFTGLDYWKFAKEVDVATWDNYPAWHNDFESTEDLAANVSFVHDIYRSLKGGQPFLIMESTPSLVNWHDTNKLKRPGMHLLSSMQGVAHGADSVLYFQWRKGRGASEKFHGAVVDHCGHENTRVFREVTEVGEVLKKIKEIQGSIKESEVAIIFDVENLWAIDDAQGLKKYRKGYEESCQAAYKVFWENGISVDIINMDCDISDYKLVIAPMLYMIRANVAERINEFVKTGGTFVTTYFSGIVDENDLCFLGGFPGPLREVTGIWSEEIDSLYDDEVNYIEFKDDKIKELKSQYEVKDYCDLIHVETAKVLGVYKEDFYADMPALTVNNYGVGKAYYISARTGADFNNDFYSSLIKDLNIKSVIEGELPQGVTAQMRSNKNNKYTFIMNFTEEEKKVDLGEEIYFDMLSDEKISGKIILDKYGLKILKQVNHNKLLE